MPHDLNVRTLPWLPVRYLDGEARRIGLERALADAHLIRDLDEPRAGLRYAGYRFLQTMLALVVRAGNGGPHATARDAQAAVAGLDALPAQWVAGALDQLGERLSLVGATPFCQEPRLATAKAPNLTAARLEPGYPGDTTKTWFTVGRGQRGFRYDADGSIPVDDAPLLLLANHLFSLSNNNSLTFPEAGAAKYGTAGSLLGGSAPARAGVRAMHLGGTLLETLLYSTPAVWSCSAALPGWATAGGDDFLYGTVDPFEAAFVSGNDQLLAPPTADGRFERAYLSAAYRTIEPISGLPQRESRTRMGATRRTREPSVLFTAGQLDPHAVWADFAEPEHDGFGIRRLVAAPTGSNVFADLHLLVNDRYRPAPSGFEMLAAAPHDARVGLLFTALSGGTAPAVDQLAWLERTPTTVVETDPDALDALEPFARFLNDVVARRVRSAVRGVFGAGRDAESDAFIDRVLQAVSDRMVAPDAGGGSVLSRALASARAGERAAREDAALVAGWAVDEFTGVLAPICSHGLISVAARQRKWLRMALSRAVRDEWGDPEPASAVVGPDA